MPSIAELEQAFKVYFDEMDRCRAAGAYWALLHVVVILPDICAALEGTGWAKAEKYVDWCRRYWPHGLPTPEDFREIRDRVLHQGQTVTSAGRFYKFSKPTESGIRVHRHVYDADVVVLDVGQLATEMVTSVRAWFADLQSATQAARNECVARNLPSLVIVEERTIPGISGATFNVTNTATGTTGVTVHVTNTSTGAVIRKMP